MWRSCSEREIKKRQEDAIFLSLLRIAGIWQEERFPPARLMCARKCFCKKLYTRLVSGHRCRNSVGVQPVMRLNMTVKCEDVRKPT